MKENIIEIPFGAYDSELGGFEYTIPEGFNAEIKDGKVIVRKAESEDEKIRKDMIDYCHKRMNNGFLHITIHQVERWLAWLEKQGEKKFTFKAIPRLLDMVESSERAKNYIDKLANTLDKEGYHSDAKIVRESIKIMNGEKVAMATMDENNSRDAIRRLNYEKGQV